MQLGTACGLMEHHFGRAVDQNGFGAARCMGVQIKAAVSPFSQPLVECHVFGSALGCMDFPLPAVARWDSSRITVRIGHVLDARTLFVKRGPLSIDIPFGVAGALDVVDGDDLIDKQPKPSRAAR